ncbi:MAG: FAD:protein FMN transferase [Gammaproteobacteria bacterium]|jgi:thiamine biosynthesis lipoprotein|nr:FAD:protein FMN transferase [Gammaproteobacteria bacterium]MBT3725479.1 FAD:protein FMN transferase [Gammaproteobacteria bacterium]MBT4078544.1 FAD:protein FMN transferase [Gammaproteobacteria bacterium]MBT4195592.1 FAD:protein FMN transferase [Gammaproteobacteria bacterium]MBT4448676.1 FAD:protein FMN transferase [Gammaproteobacteria bacterium]
MHTEQAGKSLIKHLTLIAFTLFTLVSLNACQSQQVFQQRFLQFGTIIDISLVTKDQDKALQIFNEIETLLKRHHTEWHGWQDGTLKQFNQALLSQTTTETETGVPIPETLRLLIHDSKKYFDLSGGLFNPAMGKLIEAWGFHQQATPNLTLIEKIKQDIPGMHDLIIKNNHAMTLNPYLQLDFGAIAKGLAVKQISHLIQQHHIKDFIINAGGDIFAAGQKQGKDWQIAIENPFYTDENSETVIARLPVSGPQSIFTSGNYRRFYVDKNNLKRHHIIDPVSGEPSLNISAITVMHKDPVIADIAATTLMLTKISELKNMAEILEIKDFLAISDQHELYITKSMMKKIEWTNESAFKVQLLHNQINPAEPSQINSNE